MSKPSADRDNRTPGRGRWRRFWIAVLAIAIAVVGLHGRSVTALAPKGRSTAAFNQPQYYPLKQTLDPTLYRPNGEWLGRLILPTPAQVDAARSPEADWVWIELYHVPAAAQALVGKVVKLTWQDGPSLEADVRSVTTDVRFGEAADRAKQEGNILPERLNNRPRVGPLQSLAGARPTDDLLVRLEDRVQVSTDRAGQPLLQIAQAPLQVTGRYVGLVNILGPDPTQGPPAACPGSPPCPSDYYRVRHYNAATKAFDGPLETVRIPQQPIDRNGRFISTARQIAENPVGAAGWYLYGAQDAAGRFTVQALKPRSLVQLQADRNLVGIAAGLQYLRQEHWRDTPQKKGTLQRVQITPLSDRPAATPESWKVGDRALVLHAFGGIGGPKGEGAPGATVTGHFAFGVAQVAIDPFTQEPQFDIRYHQIYAHNPNGIVSGSVDWSAYAGDLQRGWLGSRPLSDVLIKLDIFTDLTLGDRRLSLLDELLRQTQIIAARYRTGDGTGLSSVTPATSCVQDSNQALYIAIQQIQRQVLSDPSLVTWLADHPRDPETLKFQHLAALGKTLDRVLSPYGVVRRDWQTNAAVVEVDGSWATESDRFIRGNSIVAALLSWRSMLPRRSHDELATIFLNYGAQLWFLRPNQILGWDPSIAPMAPTLVLGQIPVLSTLLRRLTDSVSMPLQPADWFRTLGILLGYGAIALPLGWRSGFLRWQPAIGPVKPRLLGTAQLLVMPALVEELVFRMALIPHPLEGASIASVLGWSTVSLGLFVIYHPLNARLAYPAGHPTFSQPMFLTLAGLLGIACSLAYVSTGSLWMPVLLHWGVVTVWLWGLGGAARLRIPLVPSTEP